MKKIFNLLIATGGLTAGAISPLSAVTTHKLGVTNGKNAKYGSAPYFCTVTATMNPKLDFGLGGALISPWWVLSCAHDNVSLKTLPGHAKLIFNMYDREHINYQNVVFRHSQKIIINPTWLKNNLHGDLALIKLDKPIYNIKPIALPNALVKTGDMEHVFGYGISGVDPQTQRPIYDNHLKDGAIPVLDSRLGVKFPYGKFDPKSEILAGSLTGKRIGAALSDSGGPLISYHNGKPILDGVVSRGTEPYSYGWIKPAPGIYTSTYANLTWILQTMQNN